MLAAIGQLDPPSARVVLVDGDVQIPNVSRDFGDANIKDLSWVLNGYARSNTNSWIDKIRWARDLFPTEQAGRTRLPARRDDRSIRRGELSDLATTAWWEG